VAGDDAVGGGGRDGEAAISRAGIVLFLSTMVTGDWRAAVERV
jgi:hypothetical protein